MRAATLFAALTLMALMIPNCAEGMVYFQRLFKNGPAMVSFLITFFFKPKVGVFQHVLMEYYC